jgi:hypothetical protein
MCVRSRRDRPHLLPLAPRPPSLRRGSYSHPHLALDPDDPNPGPLQQFQAAILDFITLCQARGRGGWWWWWGVCMVPSLTACTPMSATAALPPPPPPPPTPAVSIPPTTPSGPPSPLRHLRPARHLNTPDITPCCAVCVCARAQDKYDEMFEPFFRDFVTHVWALLAETDPAVVGLPAFDAVVLKGMRFLTACIKQTTHTDFFGVSPRRTPSRPGGGGCACITTTMPCPAHRRARPC